MPDKSARRGNGADHTGDSVALASGRITDALREAILSGRLKAGSRVRQAELAEEFGISRIPVREALRQLESEGLMILVPNSGAWVSKLDRDEYIEIYKVRERLEPLAISESSARLAAETIERMEELILQIEQTNDPDDFLRLDREFHLLSYEGANMPQLTQMIHRFWNSTQQYRRAFTAIAGQDGMAAVHAEHRLILDALRRRDAEQSALILYGHIRRTRLQLEKHPEIFA
ncbi:GntR family transcriptional regulator [Aquamicrobium segne]|uniref:GntR family transcriptional regulator n=1 Tax=Aquamicrobium segne TaxID=469547 RepID=A0ABW0H1C8_9HYPH